MAWGAGRRLRFLATRLGHLAATQHSGWELSQEGSDRVNLVMPGAVPQSAAPCQLRVLPGVAGGQDPSPQGWCHASPPASPF